MAIYSLPSPYGIGTLGKEAYKFADFLEKSGQSLWQLLPMGHSCAGNSPYSLFSSFAGNPLFIDLDILCEEKLLKVGEIKKYAPKKESDKVEYDDVIKSREKLLRIAYERGSAVFEKELNAFRNENLTWLSEYSVYLTAKKRYHNRAWTEWDNIGLKNHRRDEIEKFITENIDEIKYHEFTQFLFFRQWEKLRRYVSEKNIKFIGDVPIYVPLDSSDVWSEQRFFRFDDNFRPRDVSGCPPDAFSSEGQLWGNPLYDYDEMKKDGYGWWIRRIGGAARLYDIIRIDHFRGFESYWAVDASEKTAEHGRWIKGPGMSLVGVIRDWFSDTEFIAEDLGVITPEVEKLLSDSGFPGMKVLEFAFDSENESKYLPHNYSENSVCYVGTHDNDTIKGWLKSAKKADAGFAAKYMHITDDEGWNYGFIRTGMASVSKYFIMQMQDILCLPGTCRTNVPGSVGENWQWRMEKSAINAGLIKKLKNYTVTYKR